MTCSEESKAGQWCATTWQCSGVTMWCRWEYDAPCGRCVCVASKCAAASVVECSRCACAMRMCDVYARREESLRSKACTQSCPIIDCVRGLGRGVVHLLFQSGSVIKIGEGRLR